MNYIPNQNEKVIEETLAGFNSDDVETTLRRLRCFKKSLSCNFFENLTPFLCHFVRHNREQRLNRGFMWPTCQTSNNSVISITW